MQGSDPAKSFLEKLKLGRTAAGAVDNNAPPDSDGVIIRRVERQYASEPLSALGLKLTDDGEVLSTEAGSPAANSNILPHYMIIAVNGTFVGSRLDFEEIASQPLNLIIKLQSTAAMSELLANILDEEEKKSNENIDMLIDTNSLLQTTPRYGFLSAEHPMFLRWNQRLQTQREARQLIRQATRKAEEQQAKEALEMLKRVMETSEVQQNEEHQEEKQQLCHNQEPIKVPTPDPGSRGEEDFLLKRVQDESSFGTANQDNEAFEPLEEASPEELLRLIGAKPMEESVVQALPTCDGVDVRFFINPTEEYTLSNGMRVTVSIKQRSGPIPEPPPGKPPKRVVMPTQISANGAVQSTKSQGTEESCTFCYMRGHLEKDCGEKKEQERKLAGVPRERQICRDYMRGRCNRSDCIMKHTPSQFRDRRSRSRSRDRSARRRSRDRDRHRKRTGRERSGNRRRSRRRGSSERFRRRK